MFLHVPVLRSSLALERGWETVRCLQLCLGLAQAEPGQSLAWGQVFPLVRQGSRVSWPHAHDLGGSGLDAESRAFVPVELRLLSSGQALLAWAVSDPCGSPRPRRFASPAGGGPDLPSLPSPWAPGVALSSGVRRLRPESSRVRSPASGHSAAATLLLGAPVGSPGRRKAGAGPGRPVCPVGSHSRCFRKPPPLFVP